MIQQILIVSNVIILLLISAVHFYWAIGGNLWKKNAIPEKFVTAYFNPKNKLKNSIATFIVAFSLIGIALIVLSNHFIVLRFISANLIKIFTQVIGATFLLRAIGDFNMFGIFKKKSNSNFTKYDTKIYVPLCLFLGISSLIISI